MIGNALPRTQCGSTSEVDQCIIAWRTGASQPTVLFIERQLRLSGDACQPCRASITGTQETVPGDKRDPFIASGQCRVHAARMVWVPSPGQVCERAATVESVRFMACVP